MLILAFDRVIADLLSVAVVAALATSADATKTSKRSGNQCDAYCRRYPGVTPR